MRKLVESPKNKREKMLNSVLYFKDKFQGRKTGGGTMNTPGEIELQNITDYIWELEKSQYYLKRYRRAYYITTIIVLIYIIFRIITL